VLGAGLVRRLGEDVTEVIEHVREKGSGRRVRGDQPAASHPPARGLAAKHGEHRPMIRQSRIDAGGELEVSTLAD
jgi:hypothetical protein